ncbi:MAG TPA: hypothetical protein VLH80_07315 [Nitrospiraceae bacterium]|nr:hypothetical protein [Nitrospiraceae bacterium]
MSELERIERRLIEAEGLLRQSLKLQERQLLLEDVMVQLLQQLIRLLVEPTAYPQSTGGSISVK